jgi:hypothetical protein
LRHEDEAALEALFAEVCGTLSHAGFDVALVGAEKGTGLRVCRDGDAVVVSWLPAGAPHPVGQRVAEYTCARAALRQALLEILTQAGFAVQVDRGSVVVQLQFV